MKKNTAFPTEFEEFWQKTKGIFNSCQPSSKYAAFLGWNAALESAAQLCRDCCEHQLVPEILDRQQTKL
jgi:hypothetical protein